MELITGILATLIALAWGMYYFSPNKRKLRRIPGPSGYPLVGNALQVDPEKPHETLRKWAKEYGDIMKVNFFGEDMVVVNSLEGNIDLSLTKSNDFAGRPWSYRGDKLFSDHDIVLADMAPKWSYMKKASMTGLKVVGDQVTALDEILQRYLDSLLDKFRKLEGQNVDVYQDVNSFVQLVTFTLVFGREMTEEDHKAFMRVNADLLEVFNPTSQYACLETLPFLRGFWFAPYRSFKTKINRGHKLFRDHCAVTVEQFDGEIKCVLDSMIKEMHTPSIEGMVKINFWNIHAAASNLIIAGSETTTSALYFFVSLMATNPEIQEEAHDHVVKVLGQRAPSLKDRFTIPYVESMMLELVRLMSHLPVSVPHQTRNDTSLHGYEIPKGTQIWPNLWNLHHDEKLWEDPWEFKPKRFLDENGDLLKADHPLRIQFMAFGAGRRVCAGESLAKHRIFIFVVNMLQNFRFVKPEEEIINTDPRGLKMSFVLLPHPYKVRIEIRQ